MAVLLVVKAKDGQKHCGSHRHHITWWPDFPGSQKVNEDEIYLMNHRVTGKERVRMRAHTVTPGGMWMIYGKVLVWLYLSIPSDLHGLIPGSDDVKRRLSSVPARQRTNIHVFDFTLSSYIYPNLPSSPPSPPPHCISVYPRVPRIPRLSHRPSPLRPTPDPCVYPPPHHPFIPRMLSPLYAFADILLPPLES